MSKQSEHPTTRRTSDSRTTRAVGVGVCYEYRAHSYPPRLSSQMDGIDTRPPDDKNTRRSEAGGVFYIAAPRMRENCARKQSEHVRPETTEERGET